MDNVIVLMYLEDEEYGKRLLRFFLSRRNPFLHPELVTKREKVDLRVGTSQQKLVILTDCMSVKEDEKKEVIYLSNHKDKAKKEIFKYQKAVAVYREFLECLNMELLDTPTEEVEADITRGCYCFFSPEGTQATGVAVTMAQYLGKKGKCLYLNLTGLPVFYANVLKENPDFMTKGLGTLIFHADDASFAREVEVLSHPFGTAWMLPPMAHFKDLLDSSWTDMKLLLQRLRERCGYDYLVIELSQFFEFTLDVLDYAERVFILREQDLCGRIRCAVFRRYCQLEKKEALGERLEYILPEQYEWQSMTSQESLLELADNAQRMNEMKHMLECRREEEVDDCIIECAG